MIPYINGKAVEDPDILPRQAKHKMTLYNVFIDRFYDGDTLNQPDPLDSVLPPAQYLGGDISGLIHQLNNGYFDSKINSKIELDPKNKNFGKVVYNIKKGNQYYLDSIKTDIKSKELDSIYELNKPKTKRHRNTQHATPPPAPTWCPR